MIHEEVLEYAEKHTSPELPVLAKLNRETHITQVYPRMLAGHLQGTFLRLISHLCRPARILEVGTFTGYSTIALASGLRESGILHTIEVNPELENIIRKYLKEAGMEDKVILHLGDAVKVIPELDEEWDLVFLDADKPNYLNYFNRILPRLKPGGFLLADNALWDGKVLLDPQKMDRDTRGIAAFNEAVQNDNRVENLLLPFRDGIMMVRKRSWSQPTL